MKEYEEEKAKISAQIIHLESITVDKITIEQVGYLVSHLKNFIKNNDLPECKQFIGDFVERVDVWRDRVEVRLKTGFQHIEKPLNALTVDRAEVYNQG